jgi:hypothetical protein
MNTGPETLQVIAPSTCNPELFLNANFEDLDASVNNAKWKNWVEDRQTGGILIPYAGRTSLGHSVMMAMASMEQGVGVSNNVSYKLKIWGKSTRPSTAPLMVGVQSGSYWLLGNGSWTTAESYIRQNLTSSWVQYTRTFTSRSTSTTVYFVMNNDSGYVFIDDASLRRS